MVKTEIKEQKLVVMDGTDKVLVNWIKEMIYLVQPKGKELLISYPLGLDHLDKIVMKFKSTEDDVYFLQDRIDEFHPGLCMFNPPMYV